MNQDEYYMQQALALAERAAEQGEVPVGAVLVKDDSMVAQGWNQPIGLCDPTSHAEINALRAGAKVLDNYRLLDTTLYVTLEPCVMCIGAILHARVGRLVFGASDPKAGAVSSVFQITEETRLNHRIIWHGGVLAEQCSNILKQFFRQRR